jgi:acyl carrier protein
VEGELYVEGPHIAAGYINEPLESTRRFMKSPFTAETMFRTGDIALQGTDGEIEVIGREDEQVKIAGYRIELMDVAYAISRCSGIDEAVVLPIVSGDGETMLRAYVTVDDANLTSANLKLTLKSKLPAYMIPSVIHIVDRMPRTATGKVDREALRSASGRDYQAVSGAPRTENEAILCRLWSTILQIEKVGIDDDFFDIGGDSLRVIQLIGRLQTVFGVELPSITVFARPTIRELAAILPNGRGSS